MASSASQPLQSFATRAAAARSRFQEGSMNDRTSAAPPPDFLGPPSRRAVEDDEPLRFHGHRDDDLVYGHVGNAGRRQQQGQPSVAAVDGGSCRRSVQSAASTATDSSATSKRGGFFAPLWDGVRERLRLTRSRSATTIARACAPPSAPPAPPAPTFDGPSREEILQNYQQLIKSGFFDAHAIQSSRHKPRPLSTPSSLPTVSGPGGVAGTDEGRYRPAPTRAPPPPPPPKHKPPPPPPPRSAGETMSLSGPALSPTPAPAMASLSTVLENPSSPMPAPHSAGRGTKRSHADVEPPTAAETPARRLVKKLRKSTSRLTGDARSSAPAPTRSPSPAAGGHPTTIVLSALAGIPIASNRQAEDHGAPVGESKKLTKRRSRKDIHQPAPTARDASPRRRPRSSGGGTATGRATKLASSPRNVPRQPSPHSASRSRTRTCSSSPASHMVAPSPSAHATGVCEGTSLVAVPMPVFHYPQRVRVTRSTGSGQHVHRHHLAVVPDANRGIPHVPSIPRQFKRRDGDAVTTNDVENWRPC